MATKENGKNHIERESAAVHLCLQGKGGVGKSLVASILVQYFLSKGQRVHPVDTDPVNQTLTQYKSLGAHPLKLMRDGRVDQREFDALLERLLTQRGTFVVDSGASTFIPLWYYILENNVFDCLAKDGRRLVVHTVVTGGQALNDTLSGFNQLSESSVERNLLVWSNEFFGQVRDAEGTPFPEMAVYRKHAAKVLGTVSIVRRNQDTFGRDIEEMIARKMTFEEALRDGKFSIMAKQRLKIVRDHLFDQLDTLELLDGASAEIAAAPTS